MDYFWITPHIHIIYLFVLSFLLVVVIAISATDIIEQAITTATTADPGTFKYNHLVVVIASYTLLAIVTFSIICYRFLKTRRMLQSISKSHLPINNLPKEVVDTVQNGFHSARYVLQNLKPLSSDINHPGWANPDTIAFKGVNLKRAVIRTPIIIESTATSISDTYTRPPFADIRQYIHFLIRQGMVDKDMGLVYLEGYEKARFSKYGPTEKEYMHIMKHLAAILNQMGYYLHQKISTHFIERRYDHDGGGSGQSVTSQISGESRRSATSYSSYWDRNMYNNNIIGTTAHGNLTHHLYNRQNRTLRPHSIPGDDDVISLAQSVATWSSRSARRQSHLVAGLNNHQNEDYDERLRHIIYDRLMKLDT